jgi:hypothetical protein
VPDAPVWTYFPRKDAVIAKLDVQTPFWKMPLCLWVKRFSAWPFSGCIMSAAFDHSKAPYFQGFVENQVRGSRNEVCFVHHGANGLLHWRELENFQALLPADKTADDLVEFVVKMPVPVHGPRVTGVQKGKTRGTGTSWRSTRMIGR